MGFSFSTSLKINLLFFASWMLIQHLADAGGADALAQLLRNVDIHHSGFNLILPHEEAQHSRGAIIHNKTSPAAHTHART